MSKRGGVKLKDLKAGRSIWSVSCCRAGQVSEPEKLVLQSGVFYIKLGSFTGGKGWLSPFIKTKVFYEGGTYNTETSITDQHVGIPNTAPQYNLHRWFTSHKAAMKYYNRLKADCLTKHERQCLERAAQQDEDDAWRDWDSIYDGIYLDD